MRRLILALAVAAVAVTTVTATSGAQSDEPTLGDPVPKQTWGEGRRNPTPNQSGIYDFKDFNYGTGITECPQARLKKIFQAPADRRQKDRAEVYSDGGNDIRTNEEYSCFPQNETSIDTNPVHGLEKNIVAGANDYRLGTGSSGFQASTDNGQTWYSGIIPFPSVNPAGSTQGFLVSGGDPAVVFDRAGVVYYAQIAFNRDDDTNGITVARSTNGGYTWSRACILNFEANPAVSACGGPGDPRLPGDGVVSYQQDDDRLANSSIPFDDKEYIAAGPRPLDLSTPDPDDRVAPQCYGYGPGNTRTVIPCGDRPISPDRVYVTWTKFADASAIYESHSDDQGRSWSQPKIINGSASFCVGPAAANPCEDNQFSTPTVNPTTGHVYVAFENFNTPDENQYLLARSRDGGNTWEGPFFITPVYDLNFPRAGISNRQDCTARGQQAFRIIYTNSCFRSNAGGNIVADKRGGAFADDLYLVMSDNRNGTVFSSNADVFLFKSTDGGSTWVGPTRVNNDRSQLTAGTAVDTTSGRDCLRPEGFVGYEVVPAQFTTPCLGDFGADQWWPWVDINEFGHLNVIFHDRRLDIDSTAHEWPTSRNRPGNYLVWTWGAQCHVKQADSRECLAPGAAVTPQPSETCLLDYDVSPPAPIPGSPETCTNPGADPVPGQGNQYLGTLHNFGITDVPSNFDYSFRAGIFAGDYNNVAVSDRDTKAYGYWTDARNGRSSGGPGSTQPGRNPICEQSDVLMQEYSSLGADAGQKLPRAEDSMFLVTPCPTDATQP